MRFKPRTQLLAIAAACLLGCATPPAPYSPAPEVAARFRLITQAPGNVTFEIKPLIGCEREGAPARTIAKQIIGLNAQSLFPTLATMPRLDMPGRPDGPAGSFAELLVDADTTLILRAYAHTHTQAAGSRVCDLEFGIRLTTGQNYEFTFGGGESRCTGTLVRFEGSNQRVAVPLQAAPTTCPKDG